MEPATGTIAPPSVSLTRTSALRWLLLVGVAYAALQLLLFDLDRAPSWDEAIYLSQVAPGAEAYNFTASRARGITVLVAPLIAGGSMQAVRLGLALLAALGLVGAFLPWIATTGTAVAAGAAFFGSTWTTSLYGSEVMPNLWVAFAGVGALGFVARPPSGRRTGRDDLAAAALLFAAAVFRPFDAVLLAVAAAAAALFVGRPLRSAALLVAAAAAGCLPWLVEMAARYGGIDAALAQAIAVAHVSVPAPWERIVQYLATADGPTVGPVADPGAPIPGLLTILVATLAAGAGVVGARATPRFGPLAASLAVAVSFAVAYVVLVGGVAPRFLTPAVALFSVSVGGGLLVLWRRTRGTGALRAILLVSMLAWPVWQASVAVRLESSAVRQRADLRDLGSRIGRLTDGRACVVASVVGAPQIGYASGCRGRAVVDVRSVDQVLQEEEGRGVAVVFLVVGRRLDRAPPGTSRRWSVEEPATGPVTIYRVDLT